METPERKRKSSLGDTCEFLFPKSIVLTGRDLYWWNKLLSKTFIRVKTYPMIPTKCYYNGDTILDSYPWCGKLGFVYNDQEARCNLTTKFRNNIPHICDGKGFEMVRLKFAREMKPLKSVLLENKADKLWDTFIKSSALNMSSDDQALSDASAKLLVEYFINLVRE